jgi:hypothetical protein
MNLESMLNQKDLGGAVTKLLEAFDQSQGRERDLRTLVMAVLRLQRRVAYLEDMVAELLDCPPEPATEDPPTVNNHASTKGDTNHGI